MPNVIGNPRAKLPDPSAEAVRRQQVADLIGTAARRMENGRRLVELARALVDAHTLAVVAADIDVISGDAATKTTLRKLVKRAHADVDGLAAAPFKTGLPDVSDIGLD